jgi:hypothetical protein
VDVMMLCGVVRLPLHFYRQFICSMSRSSTPEHVTGTQEKNEFSSDNIVTLDEYLEQQRLLEEEAARLMPGPVDRCTYPLGKCLFGERDFMKDGENLGE